MTDRPEIPEEGKDRFMLLGDQRFDLRFDFFLCPTHGLIAPSRFDPDWTTDNGCPVPTYAEEPCGDHLTAVFLDSLLPALRKQGAEEERERLRRELQAKVEEAERRVAGESPQDRRERLRELLGSDWPVMTMMRDVARSSPPWAWWMENEGYDHERYEVEHYVPLAALDSAALSAPEVEDGSEGREGEAEEEGRDLHYEHIVYRLTCFLNGRERPTLEQIRDEFKALRDGTGPTLADLVAEGRCEECGTLAGIWHKLGCSKAQHPDSKDHQGPESDVDRD
jgi:hypothetical protein